MALKERRYCVGIKVLGSCKQKGRQKGGMAYDLATWNIDLAPKGGIKCNITLKHM